MKRKELGLTQKQIANAIGVDYQAVSTWERGVHQPRLHPWQTVILCDLLKCSLKELAEMFPRPSQPE
jgi:DNA-binding XRE family transcriptional regulator